MDIDLLETFATIGCPEKLYEEIKGDFENIINEGPKSSKFRELVVFLTDEIRIFGNVDEQISKDDDINTFLLEISGFLKELKCPFTSLTTGHISSRFQNASLNKLLLDYLINELMAFKMAFANKPQDESHVITLHESPTAASLKELAMALNMGKPPDNISAKVLFDKIGTRLDEVIRKAGPKRVGKPLFNPSKNLTDEQWKKLEALYRDLDIEYDLRRKMLLTRLDCTIQSFQWSDKIKGKEDEISKRYATKRQQLELLQTGGTATDIASLLAARDRLAMIEKTSSATVRKNTKSKIQRHIIGQVPDRGGRAWEHAPPPPEMPSWQKNRSTGGGSGGRGGGRGNYRGGGGQSNFNQSQGGNNYQQQQSYQQKSNYYQQNSGNGGGGNNYHSQQQNSYQQQSGSGSSRVQGAWSQKGQQDYNSGGGRRGNYNNDYNNSTRNDSGYSSRNDYYQESQIGGDYYGGGNRGRGGGDYNNQQQYNQRGGGRGRSNFRGNRR